MVSVIADGDVTVPGVARAKAKPVVINGLAVDIGFGSLTELQWSVPSLGIEITGSGALAPRIVSTLRRS